MIKITRNLLEALDWKKSEYSEFNTYVSPDERYELQYNNDFSHLTDENGFGWSMFIYNSAHQGLGYIDVEYMEQIDALIGIYKDY